MKHKHFNINVSGRVQGVGFRYSARSMALMLKLTGFVKNMPNREVYIEVEGIESAINEYINWCKKGPEYARVENVTFYESELKGFTSFEITH